VKAAATIGDIMSYTQKVQVATVNGIEHLLIVEGDLEVLLDEYEVNRDEIEIRDIFLSPWADDVIQHGLKAIVATEPQPLARGIRTLTGQKPWHHDLDSTIAMKVNSLLDGDISFGMDYGAATFVAFKTTMPHNQRVRDIMAIVPIGKACFPPVITTSWHDPFNTELDRLFETVEDASSTIEIGLQHLKVITALDALVQMEFIPWERQWPGIEI
jgi:hypothetical protein